MAAPCGRGARRGEHARNWRQGHHGGVRRPDHQNHASQDRLVGPGGRLPGSFGGLNRPPIASSVAWCSASIWLAPDRSGLLTLDGSSVQTDPDGSRRIVWMIKRMIKRHPNGTEEAAARITDAEKGLVRGNLDKINRRLRDQGMREIDPSDPAMKERYGL